MLHPLHSCWPGTDQDGLHRVSVITPNPSDTASHTSLCCVQAHHRPIENNLTPCDPCPTRACVDNPHLLRFSFCFPLMFNFHSFKCCTSYSSTTLGWYATRTAVRPETSKRVKRASDFPFGVPTLISSCRGLAQLCVRRLVSHY